jgi:hypothetical protein
MGKENQGELKQLTNKREMELLVGLLLGPRKGLQNKQFPYVSQIKSFWCLDSWELSHFWQELEKFL